MSMCICKQYFSVPKIVIRITYTYMYIFISIHIYMYIIYIQINSSSQCQKQDWTEHKKKCLKKLSSELLPYKEVGKILFKFFKLVQISVENRYVCINILFYIKYLKMCTYIYFQKIKNR
jgi:hypothetical protein